MKKITVTGFVNAAKRSPATKKRVTKKVACVKRAPVKRAPAKKRAVPKRVYKIYEEHGTTSTFIATCFTSGIAEAIAATLNNVAQRGVNYCVK